MGTLLEFSPRPSAGARGASWGLATNLVERARPEGNKAVLHLSDLAIVCVVAEVPVAGDMIQGDIAAVVDKVRVNRDGYVHIYARPSTIPLRLPDDHSAAWSNYLEGPWPSLPDSA